LRAGIICCAEICDNLPEPAMQPSHHIDLLLFAGCAFLILAISQMLSHLVPINMYFSFRSFLFAEEGQYRYLALAIKLAVPFVSGFLMTLILTWRQSLSFEGKLQFYADVRNTYPLSLFSAGFFSALLQAWPLVLYWEVFADPRLFEYKLYFLIAYGMYFVSFGYLALSGGLLCLVVLERGKLDVYFPGRETFIKFGSVARNGVLGFVASGLGTSIIELLRTVGTSK
jgi:hypothetical protein